MKKLWIEVDGIQINSLRPYSVSDDQDKEKMVSINLKLGNAFNIGGILITSKDREESEWFSQNWATIAGARLLDTPIRHHGKRRSKLLLEDVIGKALYLFCTEGDGQVLREFIQKGGETPKFPFFKPEEWKGSLRIPVEFIKIRFSRYINERVHADIQIGHHLIFWSIPICEEGEIKLYGDRILDPKLTAIIEQMLTREDIKEEIVSSCNAKQISLGVEFIEAIDGCDTTKTPSAIRFY